MGPLPEFYSPNFHSANYKKPSDWTKEDKISVFLDRVEGWQLGIADLLSITIPSAGWPVLRLLFSYFEMIAKYQYGFVKKRESSRYFQLGLESVFGKEEFFSEDLKSKINTIYEEGRCSLYHGGSLGPNLKILYHLRVPMCENTNGIGVILNPRLFTVSIRRHLYVYIAKLREEADQKRGNLLANFEKRFDWESGI
ncbi:MAG: hypothetical protein M0T73_00020 [Deltaproteobacteria bacterium]|nr:hypothetical protein [Deltaproteobacteria bacterium]